LNEKSGLFSAGVGRSTSGSGQKKKKDVHIELLHNQQGRHNKEKSLNV